VHVPTWAVPEGADQGHPLAPLEKDEAGPGGRPDALGVVPPGVGGGLAVHRAGAVDAGVTDPHGVHDGGGHGTGLSLPGAERVRGAAVGAGLAGREERPPLPVVDGQQLGPLGQMEGDAVLEPQARHPVAPRRHLHGAALGAAGHGRLDGPGVVATAVSRGPEVADVEPHGLRRRLHHGGAGAGPGDNSFPGHPDDIGGFHGPASSRLDGTEVPDHWDKSVRALLSQPCPPSSRRHVGRARMASPRPLPT